MYHSVSDEHEVELHPYYRTTTTPGVFAAHMRYLHNNCYDVIDLRAAVDLLGGLQQAGGLIGKRYAVVTFDDGFGDFYSNAFPLLQMYGFPATVFLPTYYVESGISFGGKRCLTWAEARELRKNNISFGSHTHSHPQLQTLNCDEVTSELRRSKQIMEDRLGEQVEVFSYPFRFPEEDSSFITFLKSELERAGYHHGVSTIIGTATKTSDFMFLRRIPINSHDDEQLFRAKLNGEYDWLHIPQYMSKKFKHFLMP